MFQFHSNSSKCCTEHWKFSDFIFETNCVVLYVLLMQQYSLHMSQKTWRRCPSWCQHQRGPRPVAHKHLFRFSLQLQCYVPHPNMYKPIFKIRNSVERNDLFFKLNISRRPHQPFFFFFIWLAKSVIHVLLSYVLFFTSTDMLFS